MSQNFGNFAEIAAFAIGVLVLVIYLVWSAATEMGTRWPGRNRSD